MKKIAVVGAGWAGLAAAVTATQAGHHATVFEASHAVGGRARAVNGTLPNGREVRLDNGQHILIGAYRDTLRLMQQVGADTERALLRLPLDLRFPDGCGLRLPRWPSPLDALAGIATAKGWTVSEKWALLRRSSSWQIAGFKCACGTSVAELCQGLPPTVMQTLIEPLCVSALNTPAERASGQVFLRVLQDSLFGGSGSSHLLLPRTDLGSLFPEPAVRWLRTQGAHVRLGTRVTSLTWQSNTWRIDGQDFDAVVWATSASHAAKSLAAQAQTAPESIANSLHSWANLASDLQFESIATVYAWADGISLGQPMLSLRSDATNPAQFAFDRGQLGGPPGLLALVVSASNQDRTVLQDQVLRQAQTQLAPFLQGRVLSVVQTLVEKRATFACLPNLHRPAASIAPGLIACGDYVQGPYPATLEGAVQSGIAAIGLLH